MEDFAERAKGSKGREEFGHVIREYILERYMLDPDEKEEDILELAKLSLKKMTEYKGFTDAQISNSFSTTDCRGTNSIVKKKTLLIMNIEKKLDVKIDDETYPSIDTVEDLSDVLYSLLKR